MQCTDLLYIGTLDQFPDPENIYTYERAIELVKDDLRFSSGGEGMATSRRVKFEREEDLEILKHVQPQKLYAKVMEQLRMRNERGL